MSTTSTTSTTSTPNKTSNTSTTSNTSNVIIQDCGRCQQPDKEHYPYRLGACKECVIKDSYRRTKERRAKLKKEPAKLYHCKLCEARQEGWVKGGPNLFLKYNTSRCRKCCYKAHKSWLNESEKGREWKNKKREYMREYNRKYRLKKKTEEGKTEAEEIKPESRRRRQLRRELKRQELEDKTEELNRYFQDNGLLLRVEDIEVK